MKWKYGNSWEKYPIRENEEWVHQVSGSVLKVWDLFDGLPDFMTEADMIYTDPPWNTGNIRGFYTKANLGTTKTFVDFTEILFNHIQQINAPVCYLEIGKQNVYIFKECLNQIYPSTQIWPVTYYRKNPSFLIRGGIVDTTFDFTDMDDMDTPLAAMKNERFSCVADLCMGRGLTATTAIELGKRIVGTELNPRRLACTIDRVGGEWYIIQH